MMPASLPRSSTVRSDRGGWLVVSLLALFATATGCISIGGEGLGVIDRGRGEVRPRLQPPTGRIESGALPVNANVDVDCDFDRIEGSTLGGYVAVDAPVRCPDEDVVRYLQASGFLSAPPMDAPPEVQVTLRFEPSAAPRFERCEGSGDARLARVQAAQRFDPGRVAYSTTEVGAIVDLAIAWEDRAPRFLNGTGYAQGVDCGPMEFMAAAERRFTGRLGPRVGEAVHAALEAALLDRVSARVAFVPRASPTLPANPNPNDNPNPNPSANGPSGGSAPSVPPSIAGTAAVPSPAPTAGEGPIAIPPAGFGRSSALVIGIDRYDHLPSLGNAVRDARAVGALLEAGYGFAVTTLENPGRAEILKTLVAMRRTLSEKDNLLIYYAGHGWLDAEADEGDWLPRDADREDPTNWISNDTITAQLRALRAKHVMVVADSCYSGELVRGIRVGARPTDYYARMAERRARVVLSSGGLEPVDDGGGRGGHSVFAAALLAALEENEAIVDGSTIFSRIRRPVMTNADQIPEYADIRLAGHDGGDFLFVRKGVE